MNLQIFQRKNTNFFLTQGALVLLLEGFYTMTKLSIRRISDIVVIIASIALIAALSIEIIRGDHYLFASWYLRVQFVICLIFIAKFFINMQQARQPWLYLGCHLPVLLISIPYLNFINHSTINRELLIALGILPTLRAMVAFYRTFYRLVTAQRLDRIFYAYIMVTILITYIASLLFYDCEISVNSELASFGDALWWAWMGLTTVGASITPVTSFGKILSVVLPLVGMMLLPLFTSFILTLHKRK